MLSSKTHRSLNMAAHKTVYYPRTFDYNGHYHVVSTSIPHKVRSKETN